MNILAGILSRQPEGLALVPSSSFSPPLEDLAPDYRAGIPENPSVEKAPEKSTIQTQKNQSKISKSKMSFHFAYPPPAVKHKQRLCIGSRLLLQIRQASTTNRPAPVLDVLSSVVFAPKLAKRFPRVFGGKADLGSDSVIIVRSPTYDDLRGGRDKSTEDRNSDRREFVAAICQTKPFLENRVRKTTLRFSGGNCWEVVSTPNGSYELKSVDQIGVHRTARWIPRHSRGPPTLNSSSKDTGDLRYAFSLLCSDTRRHPILAILTKTSIDVYDHYAFPQPLTATKHSQPSGTDLMSTHENDCNHFKLPATEQNLVDVDETLRTLIIVSGIWIALHQGFSPNFAWKTGGSNPASPEPQSSFRSRSGTDDAFDASGDRLKPQVKR